MFDNEELQFMHTLLENELMRMQLQRSQSNHVIDYDSVFGERMVYIKQLIKKINSNVGAVYNYEL